MGYKSKPREAIETVLAALIIGWMLNCPGHLVDYNGKVKVPDPYGLWLSQNVISEHADIQKPLHKYSF
jgi:hypothetical protein